VGCPAFFRLGDSRAEKTASPRSRRSLAISGLGEPGGLPGPLRSGYAAEPTLSLAAGESLIAGAGGEEGKSEIEA
jgi:hypothetical protein